MCNWSEISVADRWRCLDSADYRGEWTVVISQVHGFCLDRMAEPAGLVDRNGPIWSISPAQDTGGCVRGPALRRHPFRRLGALATLSGRLPRAPFYWCWASSGRKQ